MNPIGSGTSEYEPSCYFLLVYYFSGLYYYTHTHIHSLKKYWYTDNIVYTFFLAGLILYSLFHGYITLYWINCLCNAAQSYIYCNEMLFISGHTQLQLLFIVYSRNTKLIKSFSILVKLQIRVLSFGDCIKCNNLNNFTSCLYVVLPYMAGHRVMRLFFGILYKKISDYFICEIIRGINNKDSTISLYIQHLIL